MEYIAEDEDFVKELSQRKGIEVYLQFDSLRDSSLLEIRGADVSEKTRQLIRDAETMGKMPTFPVVFDITTTELLDDIHELLDCKKRLER